jgi:hypothetical protein
MQHSVLDVSTSVLGLRRYRVPAGAAGGAMDTPWTWGSWCLVAVDGRMWRLNWLRWLTG